MSHWSQSQFLQALGWATLNSFWQMALLWCVFAGAAQAFKLSANRRYLLAVVSLFIGFLWFLTTAFLYYLNGVTDYALFQNTLPSNNSFFTACLLSASITYLLLLVFPAVRLIRNWRFVQIIKTEGLAKADLDYRLFVRNVAERLGISPKVRLAVSTLVSSPVTVGYLKPIILLPVAAMNNLSPAQVEAILLHELSHIRRHDYLLNLMVSFIHTLLYFNPFVKLFMNTVEAERENCCDEMVLQFGYDKVGYASALLHLEKSSAQHRKALVLAAAEGQNLLTRIEKIVGMEKKKTFRLAQIVPLAAAFICILLFNSVLIIQDAKVGTAMSYANDSVFMPWQLEQGAKRKRTTLRNEWLRQTPRQAIDATASAPDIQIDIYSQPGQEPATAELNADIPPSINHIVPVNFDDVNGHLTKEQNETVECAVADTRRAVSALQWKEIEKSMADAVSEQEKAQAHQEYLREVNKVDWENVSNNLKANYEKLDWDVIQDNVDKAMAEVKLDSLQAVYGQALTELQKLETGLKGKAKLNRNPAPDCSVTVIGMAKQTLRKNLDSIKAAKPKKIVVL